MSKQTDLINIPDAITVSGSNVGIGTTNPTVAAGTGLVINGGTNQARFALKNDATGDGSGDGFQIVVTSGSGSNGGQAIFEQRENNIIAFKTNNSETMRIDSSGNVGIGTSSPNINHKLTISDTTGNGGGTLGLNVSSSGSSDNLGRLHFGNATDPVLAAIFGVADGSADSGALTFRTEKTGEALEERMRITSSGKVLVGGTSQADATSVTLNPEGYIHAKSSHQQAGIFDRDNSEGDILIFRRDGSAVGSIGVNNGDNLTVQGKSDHSGIEFGTNAIYPHKNSANVDNTIDLGEGSLRWKDLYLSGGVYLGGTGSANKLSDVETGTFSPALSGSGGNNAFTMTVQDGHYSKIGTSVTVYFRVGWSTKNGSGGYTLLTGLPFTAKPNSGSFYYLGSTDNTQTTATIGVEGNATQAIFINSSGGLVANSSVANSSGLIACVTYISTS